MLPKVGGTVTAPGGHSAREEWKNNKIMKRKNILEYKDFYEVVFNRYMLIAIENNNKELQY